VGAQKEPSPGYKDREGTERWSLGGGGRERGNRKEDLRLQKRNEDTCNRRLELETRICGDSNTGGKRGGKGDRSAGRGKGPHCKHKEKLAPCKKTRWRRTFFLFVFLKRKLGRRKGITKGERDAGPRGKKSPLTGEETVYSKKNMEKEGGTRRPRKNEPQTREKREKTEGKKREDPGTQVERLCTEIRWRRANPH